ncbi:MAG: right-handed parallel beta-helix repeat-containing protein [Deltaproteobacteria bacterium]|nr:right-handed parallel beta-helix repeat-containing protein [Deltaproteobacteria bacterium]
MVAVLGLPASGAAADFFVAKDNPGGCSDQGSGTDSQPWCTLQHAADTVTAGGTVIVKAGSYAERPTLRSSGNAGGRIVFRSEPLLAASCQGFVVNGNYVTVQGFDITTSNDGISAGGDFVIISDNYLHEVERTGINSWGASNQVLRNRIYRPQMGIVVGGDDSRMENNDVERLYNWGTMGDCDYSRFFGKNIVIANNYFHGTSFDETGAAHVDCFQTFDNNGELAQDVLFEGNRCFDFHQGLMGEATFNHQSTRLTFRNNLFAHGGAWGLCVKDISAITAVNNTFVDIYWYGVGFSGSYAQGEVIKNNIFYGAMNATSYLFENGAAGVADYNLITSAVPPSSPATHDLLDVDPQFVAYSNDNFHLQLGSPACTGGEGGTYLGAFPCAVSPPADGGGADGGSASDGGHADLGPAADGNIANPSGAGDAGHDAGRATGLAGVGCGCRDGRASRSAVVLIAMLVGLCERRRRGFGP